MHFLIGSYDIIRQIISRETDQAGRVLLPEMGREGFFSVQVTADGYGVQQLRLRDRATEPAVRTIALRPTGRLEGRLIADDKAAIKSAKVYVYQEDFSGEHTSGTASADVDDQGRFVVPAFAEGPIRLIIPAEPSLALRPGFRSILRSTRERRPGWKCPSSGPSASGDGCRRRGDAPCRRRDGVGELRLVPPKREHPHRRRGPIRSQRACRQSAPATHHSARKVLGLDRRADRLGCGDRRSRRSGDLRTAADRAHRDDGAGRPPGRSFQSARGEGGHSRDHRQPRMRWGKTDEGGAFTLRLPPSFKIEKYDVSRSRETGPSDATVVGESPLVLQVLE